jgi:hypothetical protein
MTDKQTPLQPIQEFTDPTSSPAAVVSATAVGVVSVLFKQLVQSGALDASAFVRELDDLANSPPPVQQSDEETRIEQRVFALARMAAEAGRKESP